MFRKFLVISLLLVGIFLGSKTQANPRTNLRLLLSPYAKYSRWITAQAKHETGNFTSRIFKENNNLFGMKLAQRRKTLAISENRNHAVYKSTGDSIKDLILWFKAVNFPKNLNSLDDYVRALKDRKYFQDRYSNYLNGVKSWL